MDDDIWTSSSARQIRALGNVEKDVALLLQQAAVMLERLRITPADEQTISKDDWDDLIAKEATAYFDKLDSIQKQLRRVLLDMKRRRMVPSSLSIAAVNAASSSFGTATLPTYDRTEGPSTPSPSSADHLPNMNYQEARVERDAWRGIADALSQLKALQSHIKQPGPEPIKKHDDDAVME